MNGMDRSSTVDGESPRAVEANRKLVRRFVAAVWNGEDLDAIEELATADLVVHALGANVDRTREAFLEFHTGLLDAVPDLEDVVAESDRVVVHATIRGTPESQYGVLAPTGESFETVGFQKYRIEGDRIAEVWVLPNAMAMLRQLGRFPDSPGKVLRLLVGAVRGRLVGP
jgi:predicted ester cyclase